MSGAARDPGSGVEAHIEGSPTTAFGRYQLFASLGRGGMADVFLAVARGKMGFHKLAVIKRLRQALAEEAAFRVMFLDEARLAARLSHPNIVHTYEVGEQKGVYFIAMEYLEGQSLNKVLKEAVRRKEVIEPEIGVRVIADALAGLAYAHGLADYDGQPLGIIHRDISPHNVFVTYEGHTKLVDFGIAKAALSTTETEVGVLKGKVAYMSPEQAVGGPIDQRADLFAMGIVLWELLARKRLMTGQSAANTLHKLMSEPIPRLSSALPSVDPALERIVTRSLEKDPEHRWQSALEMRDALEDWLRAHPRQVRQEDVGRTMLHLFASVREEVKLQVQRHMSAVTTATTTDEMEMLTAESIQRLEQSGANVSGDLLRLNGSGSGSGVVPSSGTGTPSSGYPPGASGSQGPSSAARADLRADARAHGSALQSSREARGKSPLLIVIAVGFFLLAGLLIVVLGLRDRRKTDPGSARGPVTSLGSATALGTSFAAGPAPQPTDTAAPIAVAHDATTASPPSTGAPENTGSAKSATRQPPAPGTPKTGTARAPTPPPPAAEEVENGFLTINVYPWAKVSEGGRVLCAATPCSKIPLSPGSHTLQLENTEQGMKQSTTVAIKSGETTTRAIGFK